MRWLVAFRNSSTLSDSEADDKFHAAVKQLFDRPRHPCRVFGHQFSSLFDFTYSHNDGRHEQDGVLQSASKSIRAFTTRINKCITTMYPHMCATKTLISVQEAIIPSIISCFFAIYKRKNFYRDAEFSSKLMALQEITTAELGIEAPFCLMDSESLKEKPSFTKSFEGPDASYDSDCELHNVLFEHPRASHHTATALDAAGSMEAPSGRLLSRARASSRTFFATVGTDGYDESVTGRLRSSPRAVALTEAMRSHSSPTPSRRSSLTSSGRPSRGVSLRESPILADGKIPRRMRRRAASENNPADTRDEVFTDADAPPEFPSVLDLVNSSLDTLNPDIPQAQQSQWTLSLKAMDVGIPRAVHGRDTTGTAAHGSSYANSPTSNRESRLRPHADSSTSGANTSELTDHTLSHHTRWYPYKRAVLGLRGLTGEVTPASKLACVVQTSHHLCQCVDEYYTDRGLEPPGLCINADDLLSIFAFVLLRSRLPHVISEAEFMRDWVGDRSNLAMSGYFLAVLQAAIELISHLDVAHGDSSTKDSTSVDAQPEHTKKLSF